MTLGYQVPKPLGPIKGTMDIIHYLQSCLQRFSEPKLTCLHLFSNILFVFYGLPSFIFFFFFLKVSIWPLLVPSQWLPKGAGLEHHLSYCCLGLLMLYSIFRFHNKLFPPPQHAHTHLDINPTDHNMSMLVPGSKGEGGGRRWGRLETCICGSNPWFFFFNAPILTAQTMAHHFFFLYFMFIYKWTHSYLVNQ